MCVSMRLASVVLTCVVAAHAGSATAFAQGPSAVSLACDRQCLATAMDDFVKAATKGRAASIPIAEQHAEIRENAIIVPVGRTTWGRVKAVRSIVTIADATTGNVVSRVSN